MIPALRERVRRRILAKAPPIDLSRLDRVPASLVWPLRRDGAAASHRLEELRRAGGVHLLTSFLGMRVWLVTGDAECCEVLAAGAERYSTDIRPYVGARGSSTDGDIGGLGFTDPPEHTRLRRLLTPEFTMRRLARLTPRIDAIVAEQLDALEAAGPGADLVGEFAFPVPYRMICELLGLDDSESATFRPLATARFDVSGGGVGTLGAISDSRAFLIESCRRQRDDPGSGLIGQIIREHGEEISDFDLGGLADGVFTGGLETSASMLALGTLALLEEPVTYAALGVDPLAAGTVVDELLRRLAVVQVAFPRFPKEAHMLGGHEVRPGDVVLCSLLAANRERATEPSKHLSFGHGFHRCVGAELARMELRAAYPALAARFPGLRVVEPPRFRETSIVFGVDELRVTW